MHPESVGEIIHRAYNEEQRIPDVSLGNQFANTIDPRSPCRSVSRFSCISQFVWQPWKENIQTTRTRKGGREQVMYNILC